VIGPYAALGVLVEPGVADHGPGDLPAGRQHLDQGGVRREGDPLVPGLFQVLRDDEQFAR
jgi:hypothetical protein